MCNELKPSTGTTVTQQYAQVGEVMSPYKWVASGKGYKYEYEDGTKYERPLPIKRKIKGYYCTVVQHVPAINDETGVKVIVGRDNLEDAQKIVDVLTATDHSFTVYEILLTPIYESS